MPSIFRPGVDHSLGMQIEIIKLELPVLQESPLIPLGHVVVGSGLLCIHGRWRYSSLRAGTGQLDLLFKVVEEFTHFLDTATTASDSMASEKAVDVGERLTRATVYLCWRFSRCTARNLRYSGCRFRFRGGGVRCFA